MAELLGCLEAAPSCVCCFVSSVIYICRHILFKFLFVMFIFNSDISTWRKCIIFISRIRRCHQGPCRPQLARTLTISLQVIYSSTYHPRWQQYSHVRITWQQIHVERNMILDYLQTTRVYSLHWPSPGQLFYCNREVGPWFILDLLSGVVASTCLSYRKYITIREFIK